MARSRSRSRKQRRTRDRDTRRRSRSRSRSRRRRRNSRSRTRSPEKGRESTRHSSRGADSGTSATKNNGSTTEQAANAPASTPAAAGSSTGGGGTSSSVPAESKDAGSATKSSTAPAEASSTAISDTPPPRPRRSGWDKAPPPDQMPTPVSGCLAGLGGFDVIGAGLSNSLLPTGLAAGVSSHAPPPPPPPTNPAQVSDSVLQAMRLGESASQLQMGAMGAMGAKEPAITMPVRQEWVGYMIGPGGATLNRVRDATGTTIQIDQATRDQGYSIAKIYGTAEAAAAAQKMLMDKVAEIDLSKGGGACQGGNSEEVRIEQSLVGYLLGKGGETLKMIRAQSNASLTIDQNTKDQGYSIVRIFGDPQAIAAAKDLVINKVGEIKAPQDFQRAGGAAIEYHVEQPYVGWLIGKGGEMIKRIKASSGAQVIIDQSTKDQGFSVCRILPGPGVEVAQQMVEEKLRMAREAGLQNTGGGVQDEIHVPQHLVGWLIGRNGETLKSIKEQSGATIVLNQNNKDQGWSIIRFGGEPDKVMGAKMLIEQKIKEVEQKHGQARPDGGPPSIQGSDVSPEALATAQALIDAAAGGALAPELVEQLKVLQNNSQMPRPPPPPPPPPRPSNYGTSDNFMGSCHEGMPGMSPTQPMPGFQPDSSFSTMPNFGADCSQGMMNFPMDSQWGPPPQMDMHAPMGPQSSEMSGMNSFDMQQMAPPSGQEQQPWNSFSDSPQQPFSCQDFTPTDAQFGTGPGFLEQHNPSWQNTGMSEMQPAWQPCGGSATQSSWQSGGPQEPPPPWDLGDTMPQSQFASMSSPQSQGLQQPLHQSQPGAFSCGMPPQDFSPFGSQDFSQAPPPMGL